MLEAIVAELIPDFPGFGIEEAGQDSRLPRPIVLLQREIIAHQWDLVGAPGIVEHRGSVGAIRTLQVHKFDEGNFESLGWLKLRWITGVGGGNHGQNRNNQERNFVHTTSFAE